MASKRRGGFRPPELRGTLGTLLRTTTGVVRDALERGAREGRARLDGARASLDSRRAAGRRHDALADLGELLLDLIRRGEVDLDELPEARDLVRELDQIDEDAASASAADLAPDDEPEMPRAATRRRFDDRSRDTDSDSRPRFAPPRSRDDDRPGPDRRSGRRDSATDRPSFDRARRDSDDGTVSSGATWRSDRPTRPDRPDRPDRPTLPERDARPTVPDRPHGSEPPLSRAPTRPMKDAWRPHFDDTTPPPTDTRSRVDRWNAAQTHPISRSDRADPSPAAAADAADRSARVARDSAERPDRDTDREPGDRAERPERAERRPSFPRDPARKGGISFDDDEDLADYMHPDDVPPKPRPKDPGDREA